MIKINLAHLPVDNQEKAYRFYREVIGFVKKKEIPLGEYKWLTLVSPNEISGTELLLEPLSFEPAKIYQKELKDSGIP